MKSVPNKLQFFECLPEVGTNIELDPYGEEHKGMHDCQERPILFTV